VKFASGVPPSSADVDQLLSSIPSLIVNVPGFGNVDVSKVRGENLILLGIMGKLIWQNFSF